MTITDARAMDARVAEMVMGWTWATLNPERYPDTPPARFLISPEEASRSWNVPATLDLPLDTPDHAWNSAPHYTTDTAADYEVLRHVRRFWSAEQRMRFGRVLVHKIWRGRWGNGWAMPAAMLYEPGDYARAALAVMEGE